jgi:hypothetical protein
MKSKLLLPFILAFVAVIILLTTGLAWARHTSNAPSYPQDALGNGFTYQGYLTDGGVPAQGEYDFGLRMAPSQRRLNLSQASLTEIDAGWQSVCDPAMILELTPH